MGFLSDFFVAPDPPPAYAGGDGVPETDLLQLKGVSPLEAAGMLAVLRGSEQYVEIMDEFKAVTSEGRLGKLGDWVGIGDGASHCSSP